MRTTTTAPADDLSCKYNAVKSASRCNIVTRYVDQYVMCSHHTRAACSLCTAELLWRRDVCIQQYVTAYQCGLLWLSPGIIIQTLESYDGQAYGVGVHSLGKERLQ
jgi:hypothetical protein